MSSRGCRSRALKNTVRLYIWRQLSSTHDCFFTCLFALGSHFQLEEFRSTAHAATGSDTTAARVADPCSRRGSQQQPTVMTPSLSAAPAPLSQGSVELYSAEDSQHSVGSTESFCFSTGLLRPCSPQSPDDDSSRDESPCHASPSLLHMADSESPVPDSCVLDTSLNLPMLSMVQPLSNPCTNGPLISDDDAPYTNAASGNSPEVDDGDRQSVLSSPLTLPSTRTEPVCGAGDSLCMLGSDIQLGNCEKLFFESCELKGTHTDVALLECFE